MLFYKFFCFFDYIYSHTILCVALFKYANQTKLHIKYVNTVNNHLLFANVPHYPRPCKSYAANITVIFFNKTALL